MSKETAREVWTNAPEGFDPSDRNALHARFPDGYIVVQVDQGRTLNTPGGPPEGYRDFNAVTFHGVELQATVDFAAELEDEESIGQEIGRVPSGSFEVIYVVRWQIETGPPAGYYVILDDAEEGSGKWAWGPEDGDQGGDEETREEAVAACWRERDLVAPGRWRFELWREGGGGEVVYHAFADDEGSHVCAGCIGDGLRELDVGRLGVSPPDCPSCGATPEEPHEPTCGEIEEDGTTDDPDDPDDVTGPDTPRRARNLLESLVDSGEATPEERARLNAKQDAEGRELEAKAHGLLFGDVERLDFSKPPPGYRVMTIRRQQIGQSEQEIAAAAWTHYKARNDPPGMKTLNVRMSGLWCPYVQHADGEFYPVDAVVRDADTQARARVYAWAWHDRRHALLASVWPRILTFSDQMVAAVEGWLAREAV